MPNFTEVTAKQEKFLVSLLSLPTMRAAASAAGVSEDTASNWLKRPEMQARFSELKKQFVDESLNELTRHVTSAVATIAKIMNDTEEAGAVRLRAASLVLEQTIQLQKVSALEKDVEELKLLLKERPQ